MKKHKTTEWILVGFGALSLIYIGWVIEFEMSLGINQPQGRTSIVIATLNEDNERHERVLSLREVDGNHYIAANHWPRAWYHQALDNPNVEVKMPGEDVFLPFLAVPLDGVEETLLSEEYRLSVRSRAQMGFPPRYFLRLDTR
ncbi:MAG: hypothetical protein P8N11_12240 [Gammaproteobacteria bacterium]|jgi:hypothetical protein|nr:hypothetical protein [Gammaproteobacteria bacterium]